ncbi:sigma-70 family RNA polymerase sigma factor [Sorangium sp. So ce726]|uniref:sigma-70 family RNA polymerase sigma factor n=1 Tax=Sorangium sp. So ce726 TaxID=3133319 RepID=UPI003F623F37
MGRLSNDDERAAAHARLFCPALVRAVLGWLRRLGIPRCHRTDVAGQVWLNAWQSWPRFDPKRGRPERWLNAITVHVASHYHERMRRRREELVALIDVADPAPDAAATMESDSIRAGAIDAVNELEPKLRFVLVAHDLNGVSMAHIAEEVGLPLSVIYKRRTQAIRALRDIIELRENTEDFARRAGQQ